MHLIALIQVIAVCTVSDKYIIIFSFFLIWVQLSLRIFAVLEMLLIWFCCSRRAATNSARPAPRSAKLQHVGVITLGQVVHSGGLAQADAAESFRAKKKFFLCLFLRRMRVDLIEPYN